MGYHNSLLPSLSLSRELIEQRTTAFPRTAKGTRPDVRIVDLDSGRIVIKDFRRSAPLFRLLIAPILIRRETGALRALDGSVGIPRFLGRIDRDAFAMEYLDGRPGNESDALPNDFYDALRAVVEAMHSAGIAHCDLRAVGNILVGSDGRPYLVDFAACAFRGRGINPITRRIFELFALADLNAVLRLKRRLSPQLLTEEDRAQLAQLLPFEKEARALSKGARKLIRLVLARR